MMKFNLKYFLLTIVLFISEVLIATVWKENVFVRSYLGDVIVVILIYTFVLSFFKIENNTKFILGIFVFSVLVETLQYFKIADVLGLKPGSIAAIVVGNSFSWIDILCYGIGCLLIFFFCKMSVINPKSLISDIGI
jgi:hypothetical protein